MAEEPERSRVVYEWRHAIMSEIFDATFIGDKVSRVKFTDTTTLCETFLTGTYDTRDASISLWSMNNGQERGDSESESHIENLCKLPFTGEVMGLDYEGGLTVASSSLGDVSLYKIDNVTSERLQPLHCWRSLHKYKSGNACPCTDVSIEDNIASCGEDGSIHILDTTKPQPIRSLEGCDCSVLTSVLWVTQHCVAAVNTCGQLKVYDARQAGAQPVQRFALTSEEINALSCLAKHPSQHHLVATGSYSGRLAIYDLRQDAAPVTILEGHNGSSITDVVFHPSSPDSIFSAASDGSVWQWNGGRALRPGGDMDAPSAWFLAEAVKHRVEVIELTSQCPQASVMADFEVNSVDVRGNTLICGTDNGSICTFTNLMV